MENINKVQLPLNQVENAIEFLNGIGMWSPDDERSIENIFMIFGLYIQYQKHKGSIESFMSFLHDAMDMSNMAEAEINAAMSEHLNGSDEYIGVLKMWDWFDSKPEMWPINA